MSLRCKQLGILSALLLVGCSEPNATFVTSEGTQSLSNVARTGTGDAGVAGVEQHVANHFGTPQDLVAWMKLPIDFGGTQGVFVAQEGSGPYRKLKVSLQGTPELPEAGNVQLSFLTGELAGQSIEVVSYNADTEMIELAQVIETAPVADSAFVLNPGGTLKSGRALYMTHCAHCHGTSGDGNGSTAEYLYPKPRDYRKGIFKFTSTVSKPAKRAKACSDDLHRIIKNGIPGTYMPSFLLLKDDELHAIVEYVRWLSMRGEYEQKLVAELSSDYSAAAIASRIDGGETREEITAELEEFLAGDLADSANSAGEKIAGDWTTSNEAESQIVPSVPRTEDTAESRKRGRQLFLSKKAQCKNCHGPLGLGNGPQTEDYEEDPVTKKLFDEPGLHDEWGNIVKPRNLKSAIYRGGRRPIDIFRRVYAGIKGAKMPAFGGPNGAGVLKDQEIWDIVNYVLSIPYEEPPEVEPLPEGDAASAN